MGKPTYYKTGQNLVKQAPFQRKLRIAKTQVAAILTMHSSKQGILQRELGILPGWSIHTHMEVLNAKLDVKVGALSGRELVFQGKMCWWLPMTVTERRGSSSWPERKHAVLFGVQSEPWRCKRWKLDLQYIQVEEVKPLQGRARGRQSSQSLEALHSWLHQYGHIWGGWYQVRPLHILVLAREGQKGAQQTPGCYRGASCQDGDQRRPFFFIKCPSSGILL